ncbi:MAG: hypothetical protein QI197_05695 [Candidatus Korarchaeota archaeon]|nr:hypothetical protein [Candidatus Korarchaeota archaeon]
MSLKEVKERLRGVTLEKAIPLKVIGEVSYYLFEGGVLAVSNFEDRDLPYLRARTTVIPFDELPDFLRKEVEEWLRG